jgi:hypothetical protein
VTETEYRAAPGVNWSTLKYLETSPLEYRYRLENPTEPTPAMLLGTATHVAVLEPERFATEYVRRPDFGDGRTKAAKEAKAAWLASLPPGAEHLSAEDYDACMAMRDAVHSHPAARALLAEGRPEVSAFWRDPATDIECKMRQDWIRPDGSMVSLKTARDVTPKGFGRDAANRLYHGQEAFYSIGWAVAQGIRERLPTTFVAVQNAAPYDVGVYEIPEEVMAEGEALCARLLETLYDCQMRGEWPGSCPGVGALDFPRWALSRETS